MRLFQKPPTAKEVAKSQQRELKGVTRDLDKEQQNLAREEKKLEAEIKAAAKRGDEQGARTLAKQLVQLRGQKTKNMAMKSKVTSTSYATQSMASQATMAKALGSATRAMQVGNQQMNVQQIQAMSMAFERESSKMEMKTSMMDDAFDDVFEGNVEEESDVMNKIYDEIGLDFHASATSVPSTSLKQSAIEEGEDDFEKRLTALKGI